MSEKNSGTGLYAHPFSAAYWRAAAAEFRDTRMLIFAALMIAVRVALKPVKIPLGAFLDFNTQLFVNALGGMVFGPVVALAAAAISDTLGYLLFPSGPYFFPFIFTEMAGSLVFALFLYRARVSVKRVILCRFCVIFFVNLLLQTPIMALYYQMMLGKSYAWIDFPRIAKNLVLFPLESVLLIFFLRAAAPPLKRFGIVRSEVADMKITRGYAVLLIALTVVSVAAAGAYSVYSYNTTSLSASYTQEERLARNEELNAVVLGIHPEWERETTVTVIESALPRFLSSEVTYTVAVYDANVEAIEARSEDPEKEWRAVRGYSRTKARNDEALTLREATEIKMDNRSGEMISYSPFGQDGT